MGAAGDPASRVSEEIKSDPPILPLPRVPTFAELDFRICPLPLQLLPPWLFGASAAWARVSARHTLLRP